MQMRALARRIRNNSVRAIKQRALRRALESLTAALRDGRQPSPRLFEQLVYGWGNEAWSASAPFLAAIFEWLPRTSGPIVECGSGISTFVLASAAAISGRRVHTFEHNSEWAERIVRELPATLRPSVEMILAPIRSYGDFDWYSLDSITPPSGVGFVVCDGPPGTTRGGRYGLSPMLGPFLKRGCVVLLDDTQRPQEGEIVGRWCSELSASVMRSGDTFSVLSVGASG
jgi:hypothetical protein